MTETDVLATLHPALRRRVLLVRDRARDELGLALQVFDGFRGDAEQARALATNASTKGPGLSYHNVTDAFGKPASLACHLRVLTARGKAVGFGDLPLEYGGAKRIPADLWADVAGETFTARHVVYVAPMMLAEESGLTSGGRWSRLQDWCHVELRVHGYDVAGLRSFISERRLFPDAEELRA